MAIFFRSRSFAAERDEPELILAIYAVCLCQLRSALKRPLLARLSPRRGYQVPSSRPAAQRNRSFANHRAYRLGRKKCENWCNPGALFALFLLLFCMLALLCVLSR
jgi:hypothetical protein